jgi:ABC-type amino acid transport substrate-binding protein
MRRLLTLALATFLSVDVAQADRLNDIKKAGVLRVATSTATRPSVSSIRTPSSSPGSMSITPKRSATRSA